MPVYAGIGRSNADPGSSRAVGDRHRPAAIHERSGCVCPVSGTVPHCPELCDLVLSQGLGIAERAQPPADRLTVDAGDAGDARRVSPGAPLANDFLAEAIAGLLGRAPRLMVGPSRFRKPTLIHPDTHPSERRHSIFACTPWAAKAIMIASTTAECSKSVSPSPSAAACASGVR